MNNPNFSEKQLTWESAKQILVGTNQILGRLINQLFSPSSKMFSFDGTVDFFLLFFIFIFIFGTVKRG